MMQAEAGMGQIAAQRMTSAEFLEWSLAQEESYELVDGRPVAITGATQRHDVVLGNLFAALLTRLRGGPCRPFTDDIAVVLPNGNVRRPDISVRCGPLDERSTTTEPTLVVEVLSPSTRSFDLVRKLNEYQALEGLDCIIMVDPDLPRVICWLRDEGGGWRDTIKEGLSAVVAVPRLRVELPLGEIYEDLGFRG